MKKPWHRERQAAIGAVRLAARACQAVRNRLVSPPVQACPTRNAPPSDSAGILAKQDRSPVTVADYASQAIVSRVLLEHFPQDAIVGEEDSRPLRQAGQAHLRELVVQHVRCEFNQILPEDQVLDWIDQGASDLPRYDHRHWTIDPIDGTKGFLRGDQYAIALALIEGGQVVLGALACPWLPVSEDHLTGGQTARGLLLVALRGQGVEQLPLWDMEAWEGTPIRLPYQSNSQETRFCESLESVHSNHALSSQLARKLGITNQPLRLDSQAKYACVALGRAGIYLKFPPDPNRPENIWDHAAGSIVVEEAGGLVSDMAGAKLDFSRGRGLKVHRGILACQACWQKRVLSALT